MLNVSYINFLKRNITGQSIQSIDVIEDWNLSYHLACAVKYIEKASHKNFVVDDLKKAAWYLNRAWIKENNFYQDEFIPLPLQLEPVIYCPQAVCDDWQLSDLSSSTLLNIFFSQGCSSRHLKERLLKAARGHLKEEIIFLEKKQNFKSPGNGRIANSFL